MSEGSWPFYFAQSPCFCRTVRGCSTGTCWPRWSIYPFYYSVGWLGASSADSAWNPLMLADMGSLFITPVLPSARGIARARDQTMAANEPLEDPGS